MNQCNAFLERQLPELDLSFIIVGPYPQTKRPAAVILFWSENNLDSYRTRTTTIMNHSKLNRGCSNIASVITTAIAKVDWNTMDANYEAAVNALASLALFKDASHTSFQLLMTRLQQVLL
jgi:hypothetical protein